MSPEVRWRKLLNRPIGRILQAKMTVCQLMWCGWCNRAFWLVFNSLQYELKTSQSQADTLYGKPPGALNSAFWMCLSSTDTLWISYVSAAALWEWVASFLRPCRLAAGAATAAFQFVPRSPRAVFVRPSFYRVIRLPLDLGWVDLDLGCSTILLGQ